MALESLQGLVIILSVLALGLFFGFVLGYLYNETRHSRKLDIPSVRKSHPVNDRERPMRRDETDASRGAASSRFASRNDRGVSPVIAVILMVAITVVLAATVYVWVQGFGASNPQPASLGVSHDSLRLAGCGGGSTWCANFTVLSVSPNFALSNLRVTDATTSVGTITCTSPSANLSAGDKLSCSGTGTFPASGDKLNFADINAGSVVTSVVLHS